jgi:hypothetical protein
MTCDVQGLARAMGMLRERQKPLTSRYTEKSGEQKGEETRSEGIL